MIQQMLAVTRTTITGIREKQDHWIIETRAAIKFTFSKKWKMHPQLKMPLQLFYGKGGKLCFIHIASRILSVCGEEEDQKAKN